MLSTNLVSYWKLSDTSDSVGSNTLTNNGSATFVAGKIGNAVSLNGSSQYLSVADTASLRPTNYTVSAWFNCSSFATLKPIVIKNYGTGWSTPYASYGLRINSATSIECIYPKGTGAYNELTATVSTMSTGTWYYIAVTFDGTTVKLYFNGVLVASDATSPSLVYSTGSFDIGHDNGPEYQNGLIDEVGLWSRALSADEVSQLFNSGRGNAYPLTDTPSLYGGVAYYKLDGNSNDAISAQNGTDTAITYNNSYGIINQGALFNGSTSQIALPNLGGSAGTAFSISMWLNEASLSSSLKEIFSFGNNTGSYGICECVLNYPTSGSVYCGFNTVYYTATSAFTASAWHHVVWIYSGGATSTSTVKVYIDGSALTLTQNGTPGTLAISNTNYAIGYSSLFSGRNWNGDIDEVGIWSRALSSTEVTALYNGGAGNQYPFTTPSSGTLASFLLNFI